MNARDPNAARQERKRLRTLVVDDADAMRLSVVRRLRADRRIEVVDTATNGAEAVDKATRLHPDLVVMDVNMPVMDGLEATRRLKGLAAPPRVLLLSAEGPALLRAALDAGSDGYCDKHSLFEDLLSQVNALFPD